MKKWPVAIFIGRFQPFHKGHLGVVRRGFTNAEHLIILCGSTNLPRTTKNPFTFAERETVIRGALSEEENARLLLRPIDDYPYDDPFWVREVQETLTQALAELHVEMKDVVLLGHKKDDSSYYLDLFPELNYLEIEDIDGISATPIREAYLTQAASAQTDPRLTDSVKAWLANFAETPDYRYLHAEYSAIAAYHQEWAVAPYPPVFVTTDVLLTYGDELLVVRRGNHPGQGQLALPGGFLEPQETLLNCALRELEEETSITRDWNLETYLQQVKCYSAPDRDPRGRLITHVFHFALPETLAKPSVKGGDDAALAFWLARDVLRAPDFFDDHYHVIREMLALSD